MAHHKKRTSKTKTTLPIAKNSPKSKTTVYKESDARKSRVSTDTVAAEAVNTQTTAGMRTNTTTAAGPAAEAAKSSAYDNSCAKYKDVSETATAAIDTAATADEGYDDLPQALPQRTAAHKPNFIFIDSINSFRYSSQWYCPSKVLP